MQSLKIGEIEGKYNYEVLEFSKPQIARNVAVDKTLKEDILLIKSSKDLKQLPYSLGEAYDEEFFKECALLFIQFTYAPGEQIVSYMETVIKDDRICPVLEIDSQEDLGTAIYHDYIVVELKQSDCDKAPGKIYVVNQFDKEDGSLKYSKFE